MPIAKTDAAAIRQHLETLGVRSGDGILVHARLISFGEIVGGIETVQSALMDAIGPSGTLIVPTYTFGPGDVPFDPKTTPSSGMGTLAEHVRALPDAVRSLSPIHSHAGIGPAAELLRRSDATLSFGANSDLDVMRQEGFQMLQLGCGFNEGATYLHQMEAECAVPYRKEIIIQRTVVDPNGTERTVDYRYFARAGAEPVINDFNPAEEIAMAEGVLRRAEAPYGYSVNIALADLHRIATELLTRDPTALVATDDADG